MIQSAYQPDPVPPAFAVKVEVLLCAEAKSLAQTAASLADAQQTLAPCGPGARWPGGMRAYRACILRLQGFDPKDESKPAPVVKKPINLIRLRGKLSLAKWTDDVRAGMMPRIRPDAPALVSSKKAIRSHQGGAAPARAACRRHASLCQRKVQVEATGARQLTLHKGQIYLEVAPQRRWGAVRRQDAGPRDHRTGTHFAVVADAVAAGVVVTQGRSPSRHREEVVAGQQVEPKSFTISTAQRASHTLEWTRH